MADQQTHFTEPGPDRQLVLITRSGQKLYKKTNPVIDTNNLSPSIPTFAEPQKNVGRIRNQIKFAQRITINDTQKLTMLTQGLEDDTAEQEVAADRSLATKHEPAAVIDSGYTSDEAGATNKPAINSKTFPGQMIKLAEEVVPFMLHFNITVNSVAIHQSSHFSLDLSNFLTLRSMLNYIEPLYLPQIPETSYHTLDLTLSPGKTASSLEKEKEKDGISLCAGILFLGESYNTAPDTFAPTRLSLNDLADYHSEKYKQWYLRNVINGKVPKRKGWTPRYKWDGDEVEVSFSMHLKQGLKKN